jgi:hypothetical protein
MKQSLIIFVIIFLISGLTFNSGFAQKHVAGNGNQELNNYETRPRDKGQTDIIDIKPPEKSGVNPAVLYYLLFGLVGLFLLIACMFFYKKRKKHEKQTVLNIPADQIALESLARLEQTETADIREFYFRLSMILRVYIHAQFGIEAPEMTTEEFIPKIKQLDIKKDIQEAVKSFVLSSDPIKFAGMFADKGKVKTDIQFVKDFVMNTAKDILQREAEKI